MLEGPGDGLQPSRFLRPLVVRMRVINPSSPLSHEVSDKKVFYLIIITELGNKNDKLHMVLLSTN